MKPGAERAGFKKYSYSLKTEIIRELTENNLDKCLIDTSPFLQGQHNLHGMRQMLW